MISMDGDGDTIYGSVIGELIRCKDCIRWRRSKTNTAAKVCDWDRYEKTENDYCSWAVKKMDEVE